VLPQAKQLALELSQPVAAISYRAADREMIGKHGNAAGGVLLDELPEVLGE
jgi:hypothetical protein